MYLLYGQRKKKTGTKHQDLIFKENMFKIMKNITSIILKFQKNGWNRTRT